MSSAARLNLRLWGGGDAWEASVVVRELLIAGWTARDPKVVEHHVAELAALGVEPPKERPCFYRVAASLLTTSDEVESLGPETSGEVEAVLVGLKDGLWVGVGSDHTDRGSESYSVALSKQACAKPIAPELWKYSEVAPHWDRLTLRSFAIEASGRRLYQEGTLAHMRTPEDLIARYLGRGTELPAGMAMFCGTLPALHGVRGGFRGFEFELDDPVLRRSIRHEYRVKELPRVG